MRANKRSFMFSTPQLAREWASRSRLEPKAHITGETTKAPSQISKPSRRKGGRKIGKAESAKLKQRGERTRAGELKDYSFTLARRENIRDPFRTLAMASDEAELWSELSRLHLAQLPRSTPTGIALKMVNHDANELYSAELYLRMQEVQVTALDSLYDASLSESVRMLRFHAHRRMLGILHQEGELLRFEDAQARAVGEDEAFIAAGRSIKQRSFAAHFGWWQPNDLLRMHGKALDEESAFLRPDSLLADAVAEVAEEDRLTAALFDVDAPDDFTYDD